ncbi:gluconate 2-dehydrogenase subunit 3 family protein [Kribbella swartbergensis]
MPESRYPTHDEFWRRLDERQVEPDLQAELRERTRREEQGVLRLPAAALVAVVARLVPGTIPPEALAAFIDDRFDQQLGRADDKAGLAPRAELIPAGLRLLDEQARGLAGVSFAELDETAQDDLLRRAERGRLQTPDRFDWSVWFRRIRALALLGLGSDPRGMVFMGFPGPSYRSGYVWLDEQEVAARAARRRGYLWL